MKYFNLFFAALLFSVNCFGTPVIPNLSVTTAKIANSAVTTAKILDGAVTKVKQGTLGQQLSSSSSTFSTSATSLTDVTNLTVTITTTGRPVFVGLVDDGTHSGSYIRCARSSSSCDAEFAILRGATVLMQSSVLGFATGATEVRNGIPVSALSYIDPVAAGTYTYKVQAYNGIAGSTPLADCAYAKLIAFEL